MTKYFLLALPLLRFFFLVNSSVTFIDKDGDTAQEVETTKKESNSPNLISTDGGDLTKTLEKALQNYDRRFPPNFVGGPVIVKVTMTVLSIPIFREKDFRWIIEAEIAREWKDERLNLNSSKVINLSPPFVSELWIPDIAFQAAESRIHSALDYGENYQIRPDGMISHVFQVTLSTYCQFDLHEYPFDQRLCKISFGSFFYSGNEVMYKWADDVQHPVLFLKVALKPVNDWKLDFYRLSESINVCGRGTNISRINFEMLADRRPAWGIIFFVIAQTALVLCSWIPTFIPDNLSARIISGVGILGATVVMFLNRPLGSENALPYYTYVDLYSMASLLEVIASLWQSAVVIYMKNRENARATNGTGAEKWNRVFHMCTPIATIIIVGGFGIAIFLMFQARIPDHSLRSTVLAICDDTEECVQQPHQK